MYGRGEAAELAADEAGFCPKALFDGEVLSR